MRRFFVGLDLGQSQDYTAIAVLEKIPREQPADSEHKTIPAHYRCRHLERFPLGTRYPTIVENVKTLLDAPQLKIDGKRASDLVADATGVGRPVVDMLRASGLSPSAVLITGGDAASYENGFHRVPKRELVSVLQVLLQADRLKIANDLPLAQTFLQEAVNFQVKITAAANETYGAWREGTHDDLVLAVALAAWRAENIRELHFV